MENEIAAENPDYLNLPEALEFAGNPETAFRYWNILHALDYKWDLETVKRQDEVLTNDISEIEGAYGILYRQAQSRKNKKRDE